jgi:adenine-specific DNA methylase
MSKRAAWPQIQQAIAAERQEAARHYGVHPYFTRRPANVVRAYIETYSRAGDVVLDPFGGTGVTAIEAMLHGRTGVHNDLNPFANFIAGCIADTTLGSIQPLVAAFEQLEELVANKIAWIQAADERQLAHRLRELDLPENIPLPKTSDAERFHDLFTPRQLAGIATLREGIHQVADRVVRDLLLLAWSASIAKLNRTFLSAKGRAESRGGSSIFSIYRYKLAKQCVELPIWETFEGRFRNVLAAKKEVFDIVETRAAAGLTVDSRRHFRCLADDAATLGRRLGEESVDYIFTDPPYGGFISYLDLSILWNHWLGFHVTKKTRSAEAIVGGEQAHTEKHYKSKLAESMTECIRMLRNDRWFSVVFQHWDPSYFSTILDAASEAGADFKTAITQTGDVIWSMHKKKNSESVIAGELILTFHKPATRRKRVKGGALPTGDINRLLEDALDECLTDGVTRFTSEALFNKIVMELWHRHALACLELDRQTFAAKLRERGWCYDERRHEWRRGKTSDETQDEMLLPLTGVAEPASGDYKP